MNRIREARKAAGLSQGQLARMIGVTQGAISQWEMGLTNPKTSILPTVAKCLKTTVDDLLKTKKAG